MLNQLFLLSTHQGRGGGRSCVRAVLAEARELGRPVRLQALKRNERAQALFRRLGFAPAGETETHVRMERGSAPQDHEQED